MMEPLKDQFFNLAFYSFLEKELKRVVPKVDTKKFSALTANYKELELMDRLKQVGNALGEVIPGSYLQQLEVIKQIAPAINSFPGMVFPYFVEQFGKAHFDESMEALRYLTPFSSSEFAVRVFIKQDLEKALAIMTGWAEDKNNHVRRLASEGSRPLLPWSFKLDDILQNPQLTAPILTKLQKETDLYVKKSVGNHLNDHAKKHPLWVTAFVKEWDLTNKHAAWMAKRGVRTLIKDGFPASFSIMGFEEEPKYSIKNFTLDKSTINLGEEVCFSFDLQSLKSTPQLLNVDFVVYYTKSNGKLAPKVFKLKEVALLSKQTMQLTKKQRFDNLTTRKHYAGEHKIAIKVNGVEGESIGFTLSINE